MNTRFNIPACVHLHLPRVGAHGQYVSNTTAPHIHAVCAAAKFGSTDLIAVRGADLLGAVGIAKIKEGLPPTARVRPVALMRDTRLAVSVGNQPTVQTHAPIERFFTESTHAKLFAGAKAHVLLGFVADDVNYLSRFLSGHRRGEGPRRVLHLNSSLAGAADVGRILPRVDVLVVSQSDLLRLTGLSSIVDGICKLRDTTEVGDVIVLSSALQATGRFGGGQWHEEPAFPHETNAPLATAEEVFAATFAAAQADEHPIASAMKLACAQAAMVRECGTPADYKTLVEYAGTRGQPRPGPMLGRTRRKRVLWRETQRAAYSALVGAAASALIAVGAAWMSAQAWQWS